MSWTAEEYTRFALQGQLRSLWQIASWIARHTGPKKIAVRDEVIIDLGAGPTILSNLVGVLTGARVAAAVQDEAYLSLARDLPLPGPLVAPRPVTPHLDPAAELCWLQAPVPLIFSYACLHEFTDVERVLRSAVRALAPGGLLVLIDTMAEAGPAVSRALDDAALPPSQAAAIRATFDSSLDLKRASAHLTAACPGPLSLGVLELDEELLLECELDAPVELPEEPLLDPGRPTLFFAEYQHEGAA